MYCTVSHAQNLNYQYFLGLKISCNTGTTYTVGTKRSTYTVGPVPDCTYNIGTGTRKISCQSDIVT
jgi:hypothetical protein